MGKKLFLDTYAFYNKYKGFEAVQLVAQLAEDAGTEKDLLYQTYFTTDQPVSSFGWAVGLDYMTPVGILIRSNVACNKLLEGIDAPGVEAGSIPLITVQTCLSVTMKSFQTLDLI